LIFLIALISLIIEFEDAAYFQIDTSSNQHIFKSFPHPHICTSKIRAWFFFLPNNQHIYVLTC